MTIVTAPDLRDAYTRAWIDGLHRKADQRPTERPAQPVRLDDTGRAPVVPLRGARA